jgi:hypothetical protein
LVVLGTGAVVVVVVVGAVVVVVAGAVEVVVSGSVVVAAAAALVVVVDSALVVVVDSALVVVVATAFAFEERPAVADRRVVVVTGSVVAVAWWGCPVCRRWVVAPEAPVAAKEFTRAAMATTTTAPPARARPCTGRDSREVLPASSRDFLKSALARRRAAGRRPGRRPRSSPPSPRI